MDTTVDNKYLTDHLI